MAKRKSITDTVTEAIVQVEVSALANEIGENTLDGATTASLVRQMREEHKERNWARAVNVAVSDYKKALDTRLGEVSSAVKLIDADIEKADKQRKTELELLTKEIYRQAGTDLGAVNVAIMAALVSSSEYTLSPANTSDGVEGRNIVTPRTMTYSDGVYECSARVAFGAFTHACSRDSSIAYKFMYTPPKAHRDLLDEIERLDQKRAAFMATAVQLREQQQKVPAMREEMSVDGDRQILGGSNDGKQLLACIDSTIERYKQAIPALPCVE